MTLSLCWDTCFTIWGYKINQIKIGFHALPKQLCFHVFPLFDPCWHRFFPPNDFDSPASLRAIPKRIDQSNLTYCGSLRNPAPVDRCFVPLFIGFQMVSTIRLVVWCPETTHQGFCYPSRPLFSSSNEATPKPVRERCALSEVFSTSMDAANPFVSRTQRKCCSVPKKIHYQNLALYITEYIYSICVKYILWCVYNIYIYVYL